MDDKKINLNVSGKGKLNVGNVVQGDVQIHGGQEVGDKTINSVDDLRKLLGVAAAQSGVAVTEVEGLLGRLKGELAAAQTPQRRTGLLARMLDLVKEHHAWAFPVLQSLGPRLVDFISQLHVGG